MGDRLASSARFVAPAALSLGVLAAAGHESSLPFVLGRWSLAFAAALAGGAVLAGCAWWLALREPRPGSAAAGVALLLASCAASVLLGEAVFRAAFLEDKLPADPAAFTEMIASDWPEPRHAERRPGVVRVLGLSDSFGRAGGPHNYHYLLERQLRRAGRPVELVNLSITGISPREQLELLERWGAHWRPDVVLHGVFTGNDLVSFEGRLRHFRRILIRARDGWSAWNPRNFTLVQALDGMGRVALNEAELRRDRGTGGSGGTFSRRSFLRIGRSALRLYRDRGDPAEEWSDAETALDGIVAKTRELGAAYVMLMLPERVQVEEPLRREILAAHGLAAESYDLRRTQAFLESFCERRGLRCLDLLEPFLAVAREGGYFLPADEHLNVRGNALVADLAEPFLLASGILDPGPPAVASAPAAPRD